MTAARKAALCCGQIKGGVRFCTLGLAGCSIKTHVVKKVTISEDHLFIAGARNSAHISPSLPVSKLSEGQLRRLLAEGHSVQEWTQLFHILAGYDERLDEEETEEVIKQVTLAGEVTAVGKTPKRRRLIFGEGLPGLGAGRATIPFALTPLASLSEEDDQVSRVLAQWDMLVGQVTDLTQAEDNTKKLVCGELNEFSLQLRALEASVGRDTSLDPSASVWNGVVELREGIKEHDELIGEVADNLAVVQEDIEALMEDRKRDLKASEEIKSVQAELSELTSFISAEQEAMLKDMDDLKKLVGSGGASSSGTRPGAMGSSSTAWRREVDLLRSQISNSESEVGIRMRALETAVGQKLEEVSRKVEERHGVGPVSSPTHGGVAEELKVLKEKMKILEARVSSKTVIIGGRVFSSYPDVHKYVVDSVPPNIYFLFHDPVTLLESISDAYTSKSDVMLEMHQGQKVGFANEAEATIVASFKLLLPTVFSRAKDGTVPNAAGTQHLPAVRNYQAWNPHDGVTGVKQYIEKGLDDLRRTLGNDIDSFFGEHPEARMLAIELLSLSCGFISEMCNWIDTFFHELVNLSGVTKEEAWQLISACVKKFFEDFRTVRSPAANASSDKDASGKCAKYLWAVLQVHDIMKEYRDKRFRGHPSIAPVVNFHVFQTRVTKAAFEELSGRMTTLAGKFSNFDSLQGRVAKLEKK